MAGETILASVRDQERPLSGAVFVRWVLSAPVLGPDNVLYQEGSDFIQVGVLGSSQKVQQSLRDGIAARVSEVTGQPFKASDVRGFQAIRTGTIAVALLELSKDVVFPAPMPSANYRLIFQSQEGSGVSFGYKNKTALGFTLVVSVSTSGTVDYVAVED